MAWQFFEDFCPRNTFFYPCLKKMVKKLNKKQNKKQKTKNPLFDDFSKIRFLAYNSVQFLTMLTSIKKKKTNKQKKHPCFFTL